MCSVCVAEEALWATRCGRKDCMAFERGLEIRWDDAPPLTWEEAGRKAPIKRRSKKLRRKLKNIINRRCEAKPTVFVRARGKGSEFEPATFQIRRMNDPWPKDWMKTKDLAGALGNYGLDTRWPFVRRDVKDWVLRHRRKLPTETEIERERQTRPLKVTCSACGRKDKISEKNSKGWTEVMASKQIGRTPKKKSGPFRFAISNQRFCKDCSKKRAVS